MYTPIIKALRYVNGHHRHRIKKNLQTNSIKKKEKKKETTQLGKLRHPQPPLRLIVGQDRWENQFTNDMFMWLRDYIRDNGHINKANRSIFFAISCHVFHQIIRFLGPQKARVIRLYSKGNLPGFSSSCLWSHE